MKRTVAIAFSTALAAGALSLAASPAANAAECYQPGKPSSVVHDNHELAPAPLDGAVHGAEQTACKNGL